MMYVKELTSFLPEVRSKGSIAEYVENCNSQKPGANAG